MLARCAAGLVAFLAALAGAAAAGVLTGYSKPPAESVGVAVAAVAVPLTPNDVPGPVVVCDYWCPGWTTGDDVIAFDGPPDHTDLVRVAFYPPLNDATPLFQQARQRLTAAGWTVGPIESRGPQHDSFEASRGGTKVEVGSNVSASASSPPLYLLVAKRPTLPVVALVVAMTLGGLAAGWFGGMWVARRHATLGKPARVVARVVAVPVLLTALLMALGLTRLVTALSGQGWTPKDLLLPVFLLTALPPLTWTAALCTVVLALLAAFARSRPHPPKLE
jgi:hypothetical protein